MKYAPFLLLALLFAFSSKKPNSFVFIADVDTSIVIEARYATPNNFMGRVVNGYDVENLMLTKQAAEALKNVQQELKVKGHGLKVFDAYRPQRAVDDFVAWCADEDDTVNKSIYYPNVAKNQLLDEGYIASKSGHSRGSTVDLTIIAVETEEELDMGTPWDYFGPESHGDYIGITEDQKANRQLLLDVMIKHGFKRLPEEWWHFTLIKEPYPDTYFNFLVE